MSVHSDTYTMLQGRLGCRLISCWAPRGRMRACTSGGGGGGGQKPDLSQHLQKRRRSSLRLFSTAIWASCAPCSLLPPQSRRHRPQRPRSQEPAACASAVRALLIDPVHWSPGPQSASGAAPPAPPLAQRGLRCAPADHEGVNNAICMRCQSPAARCRRRHGRCRRPPSLPCAPCSPDPGTLCFLIFQLTHHLSNSRTGPSQSSVWTQRQAPPSRVQVVLAS